MSALAGVNPLRAAKDATAIQDAAFSAFVKRNAQFAFRVAFAKLRNHGDAEDAVQEAFLKLLKKHRWQAAQDERAFLARTVWRAATDLQARYPHGPTPDDSVERMDRSRNPEQQALHAAEHDQIHHLIDALPERLRAPLALTALGELTLAEVAAILAVPEGTVRRRIVEARALLREKLLHLERHHAQRS